MAGGGLAFTGVVIRGAAATAGAVVMAGMAGAVDTAGGTAVPFIDTAAVHVTALAVVVANVT